MKPANWALALFMPRLAGSYRRLPLALLMTCVASTQRWAMPVEEAVDAGGRLKAARAEERAEERVEAEGAVAAMAQRVRQAALDPACGNAGDEISKTPE